MTDIPEPKRFHATDHDINTDHIDKDALWVIHRLKEAGFDAYLVGGSVRDLLRKKTPKDFDISTNAKPEEVKALFGRQCLLIGRRFRLAHIRFGRKIIELATFRAGENLKDELITHDNIWGTEFEDVMRRDFTINGLCYDPESHTVIDYVGGWDDVHKELLRTIGNPEVRFRQDPVRMMRLLKFRARFRYEIASDAKKALLKCRKEIVKSSPARVLEEIFRMLESGYSAPFFQLMTESKLLELIFPELARHFEAADPDLYPWLLAVDEHNQNRPKPLDRGILIASLLFPLVEKEVQTYMEKERNAPHLGQVQNMSYDVIRENLIQAFAHFPRKISAIAVSVISFQYRLTPLGPKKSHIGRTLKNRDFPYALHLLKLRARVNPELDEIFEDWKEKYLKTHPHPKTDRIKTHVRRRR
ncbi:MAG: polynucleotide adenylyltransferase PcnB [Chlamydiia bacterium]|nr:polynucleotide adenylyltransferase PcnB [Chlamydiia bacterium]